VIEFFPAGPVLAGDNSQAVVAAVLLTLGIGASAGAAWLVWPRARRSPRSRQES